MTTSRISIVLILAVLLSACGTNRSVTVSSRPIEIEVSRAADPAAVTMLPVNLRVVTRETAGAFMTELESSQGNTPVFIAMTTRDYENMALNLADLRRYIEQQRAIISYYRRMSGQSTAPAN